MNARFHRFPVTPYCEIDIVVGLDRRKTSSTFRGENRVPVYVSDDVAAPENSVRRAASHDAKD
jgi:hypothetical protein